jgi:hypothetical protein
MANGVRIYWQPSLDASVSKYEIYRAATSADDPVPLIDIDHLIPSLNWDAKSQRFFFDDISGTLKNYYQVVAVTSDGIILGDSGLFTPASPQVALKTIVPLDHNYGGIDNYQVISPGGASLAYVSILVYKAIDYAMGRRNVVVGQTESDTQGRWKSPIYVTPGLDYTIVFEKTSEWGPNAVNVTVPPIPV